jgi:Nuclease-related domain
VLEAVQGIELFHDRRMPGRRSNISHIAVTPTGVWVVDTKRYPDARLELRNGGGLLHRNDRLIVGGRDRTVLVDDMEAQLDSVRQALRPLGQHIVVRAALCFVDAEVTLLTRRPFVVRDVAILWPRSLAEVVSRPGPLSPSAIHEVATALDQAFTPA